MNNYAFTPTLNDKLSLLFLDLKEGTKIISLKPFVSENFRLTDRTVSPPLVLRRYCADLGTKGNISPCDSEDEREDVSGRLRELDERVSYFPLALGAPY